MKYLVVIETAEGNYSAYVPDLPGCIAVGDTVDECEASIQEAIEFHIRGLREDGIEVPQPTSIVKEVVVRAF
jgi:predicted RNase H-like HicB family nuclease